MTQIFPAIDLMDGGCVRLFKGDFKQRTNYDADPIEVAKGFKAAGAEWLHVVDLDGAKNANAEQSELIMEIARESGLKVQTGGGIRELYHVQRLLQGGIERVVIGSLALKNPIMVRRWIEDLGSDKIILALDVKMDEEGVPYPTSHGWKQTGDKSLWQLLNEYGPSGLETVLVTDIDKDGVQKGSNAQLYKAIRKHYPDLQLITSGGVGKLSHVRTLKRLRPHGIIIGKALYENNFTVEEAIAC
ncbi:MAG: 1-(5-phosphoribosyl)-5-[(5-phosphoribosylamino)methylideneamino]imidazole-4-carboxamide isomerase [Hellea sp.]|nr:1-(5-phosphoribosyl)-5-[(5-phosphoribosylamino)methylideneamino]imidazole-4-carboxamide isomerase [Hellea sp.]